MVDPESPPVRGFPMNAWLLVAVLSAGDPQPAAPAPHVAGEPVVTVRFLLPVQEKQPGSVEKWGLAAPVVDGFSDPNLIVYDDDYVERYLPRMIHSPPQCGAATYSISTPDGIIKFTGGLDTVYLGRDFRADDLVRFLKTRTEGKRAE